MQTKGDQKWCSRHFQRKTKSICTSPFCDYFRLLCDQCVDEDNYHAELHLTATQAYEQKIKEIKNVLTGLQAIKNRNQKQMDNNLSCNPGLTEIQQNLTQIRHIINKKFDQFILKIRKKYSLHVKEKLQSLEEAIEKSEEFLKKQLSQLQLGKSLKKFYLNDFAHQLKYYQSYLTEVFVQNVRDFKTALQNDAVLALIVTFQQNLYKILTIEQTSQTNNKSHLFMNNNSDFYKYQLTIDQNQSRRLNVSSIKFVNSSLLQQNKYQFANFPLSVYLKQKNCFYIFGEKKTSKMIVKLSQSFGSKFQTDQFYQNEKEAFLQYEIKFVKKMGTARKDFAVCLLKNEVYIIGGVNEQEGCLFKCEKFNPSYNNQIYIIASLNKRSSHHSLTTYKNDFLLKFGGTSKPYKPSYEEEEIPPQIYSLEREEWHVINFKKEQQVPKFGLLPTVLSSQKGSIIIFGKEIAMEKNIYSFNIEFEKQELKQIIFKFINRTFPAKYKIFQSTVISINKAEEQPRFLFLRIDMTQKSAIQPYIFR